MSHVIDVVQYFMEIINTEFKILNFKHKKTASKKLNKLVIEERTAVLI